MYPIAYFLMTPTKHSDSGVRKHTLQTYFLTKSTLELPTLCTKEGFTCPPRHHASTVQVGGLVNLPRQHIGSSNSTVNKQSLAGNICCWHVFQTYQLADIWRNAPACLDMLQHCRNMSPNACSESSWNVGVTDMSETCPRHFQLSKRGKLVTRCGWGAS